MKTNQTKSITTIQEAIKNSKRIVVKLGSHVVISDDNTFASKRLSSILDTCAKFVKEGKEIIIVSSGAVGLGKQSIATLKNKSQLKIEEKQACASAGQATLIESYQKIFQKNQLQTAQILLTHNDFSDRLSYLNLHKTLETLLSLKVIPVINENDTTSTQELETQSQSKSFGDNDHLSALVAGKLDADLLILLSTSDGIYDMDPHSNPNAKRIPIIEDFNILNQIQTQGNSTHGRGGMESKLSAIKVASMCGVTCIVTSGLDPKCFNDIFEIKTTSGTWIIPQTKLGDRQKWIALSSGYKGVIQINPGAQKALFENSASLLPIGIIKIKGEFKEKEIVSIQNEDESELGRGIVYFSSEDIKKIMGKQSSSINEILHSTKNKHQEVIHRDHLVLFKEGYYGKIA